jgi:hypothetical protein
MENLTRLDSISLQHQEILATQWLTAGQFEEAGELNRLCCTAYTGVMFLHAYSGIPCCKGPFVEQEMQKIHEAIKRYQMV